MMCCKEYAVTIEAITCATEMEIVSTSNATQDFPAFAGIPKWDFGSYIPGFGGTPVLGEIELVFRSPTLKTWRFGGAQFNASGTFVRGWQEYVFPVAPTILINGVPVTLVTVVVNTATFWIVDGSGLEEGGTFQTNSCSDVTVDVSATGSGAIFGGRTLIEIEDVTP